MIAAVVLAIAVVGIAGTLAASYQQQKAQVATAEATQLARQLMEEISAKPFVVASTEADTPGWSSGNTNRNQYDDVGDYNGFNDVSTSIKTLGGDTQSIGTAGPYTRSVTVVAGPIPTGYSTPSLSIDDFKTVTITVTRPNAAPVVVSKVFTKIKVSG